MFVGEIAAQKIDKNRKSKEIDREKVKQLTVVGISQGPLHHYTYEWMERLLPGTAQKTVLKKILCDQVREVMQYRAISANLLIFQFIVSPVFITHYFYTAFFLGGKTVADTNKLLFEDKMFLRVYMVDWLVRK
jgi:protein Mpv17